MRYVGIVLMAGAAVCGGFYCARILREELEVLQLLRRMVYHVKSRILHGNDALPEALHSVGEQFLEQPGVLKEPAYAFIRIARRLETEKRRLFSEIWQEEVERLSAVVPIRKIDLREFLELGNHLGIAEREMQERIFLFYLEHTDDSIAGLKEDLERKGKLYRCLGVTAGAFLIVIFI